MFVHSSMFEIEFVDFYAIFYLKPEILKNAESPFDIFYVCLGLLAEIYELFHCFVGFHYLVFAFHTKNRIYIFRF